MDGLNKHIKKINTFNYNAQCRHVKNRLMSIKSKDMPYTMFFKKLDILLHSLPWNLRESNIDIGIRKVLFINLWDRFEDENKCFYEDIGLIKIECIKLLESIYFVAIPVKKQVNTYMFFLKIKIMIIANKCKEIYIPLLSY